MSIAERAGLLTVEEYLKLAERDVFRDRVELIEGEIVSMSPQGVLHARVLAWLNAALSRTIDPTHQALWQQQPIHLGEDSLPEPDLAVVDRQVLNSDQYPAASAVQLLVEVSHSSVRFDRNVKAGLYAAAGIGELWIIDLQTPCVWVHTSPSSSGYQHRRELKPGDVLETAAVPGLRLAVGPLLDGKEPTA